MYVLLLFSSIYKQTMDKKIGSLMEAGLTKFYFDKEMDKIARIANSKVSSVRVVPLSLVHLSGPFFLWIFALLICILVFLHELMTNFRAKLRQRALDSIRQWNIEAETRNNTLIKVKPIHEGKNSSTRKIRIGPQHRMINVEL